MSLLVNPERGKESEREGVRLGRHRAGIPRMSLVLDDSALLPSTSFCPGLGCISLSLFLFVGLLGPTTVMRSHVGADPCETTAHSRPGGTLFFFFFSFLFWEAVR